MQTENSEVSMCKNDCETSIRTNDEFCSRCRMMCNMIKRCKYEGCEKTTLGLHCRQHAPKVTRCTWVTKKGVQCSNNARGERCHQHNEKTLEYRKNISKKYYEAKKETRRVDYLQKKLAVCQSELEELQNKSTINV